MAVAWPVHMHDVAATKTLDPKLYPLLPLLQAATTTARWWPGWCMCTRWLSSRAPPAACLATSGWRLASRRLNCSGRLRAGWGLPSGSCALKAFRLLRRGGIEAAAPNLLV